jgi:protein involved in polysaccharide export with SLBB domain
MVSKRKFAVLLIAAGLHAQDMQYPLPQRQQAPIDGRQQPPIDGVQQDCLDGTPSTPSIDCSADGSDLGPPRRFVTPGVASPPIDESEGNAAKPREHTKALPARQKVTEQPDEFQQFVQASTGKLLPIYGASLFDQVPSTFSPLEDIPVTPDYTVGPGDEVDLRAWGQVNLSRRLLVDRTGDIFLPQVGRISLAGLRFVQVQDAIQSAMNRVYRNFDLNVNMGQLRSIQIFIVGQALRPGSYTVSSLSTLVNALFASGGPSSRGSLRRIQLKRGDRIVTTFDLYDLLLRGDKSEDVRLQPGDVIFIPNAGPRVALEGSVETPAIYELKDETSVREILSYAGGLSATASGQRAILERIDQRSTLHTENIAFTPEGLGTRTQDGDIIRVLPVVPRFDRTVTLRGNVADAVRFPWHPGMKVSDLIANRESLLTRGYWSAHNALLNRDSRTVAFKDEKSSPTADTALVAATAKERSVAREFNQQNDLQPLAPDIDWNYATIERLDTNDLKTHLLTFNLGKIVIDHDSSADVALEPNDVVTVFSTADISVPHLQETRYVRIEGEVKTAGVYAVRPGESLRDVVARAGGPTPNAYLYGSLFSRESTRKEQQKRYEEFLDQIERDIDQNSATLAGHATSADQSTTQASLVSQHALVEHLRQGAATGRIVLGLEPSSSGVNAIPKLPLENGDRLLIPSMPSTVSVVGMVYNQGSFLYDPDMRLRDYLADAGGPSRFADRAHIFVIRADGGVVARETRSRLFAANFDDLRIYPGDSIVVPTDPTRRTFARKLLDWSQVVSGFGLGAAAVNVLR